ncbi:MAG: carbohydrate kinase [Silicimonas sp.]|nr:carbohydrate kinase [Silicimonas sp.]
MIAIGGENLIDRVQTGVADGAPVFANNPGGSPFNVAVALSRQGGDTHYLTPISTDDMGDLLADRLEASGVTLSSPRRPEATSLAIVTLNEGIPSYEFKRDGTAERCVTLDSLKAVMPEGAAAFHIGSLALAGGEDAQHWEAFFHAAKNDGIFVSLDPNVRTSLIDDAGAYRERLFRLFKSANLIKLSDEDLEWIYPDMDLATAFQTLRAATDAGLVVLTKGPDGAEAMSAQHHVQIEAPKVNDLQDTIGAGDTFMGTLLATLAAQGALNADAGAMDRGAIATLIRRAAKAAALNCEQKGCNPPTLAELDAAMAQ